MGRELSVSQHHGLVLLAVVDRVRAGACTSGPLAIRPEDVETLRSALGDLVETGLEEATS
jgi:hypothetical protein